MRLLTIDFETYWSETHTLSKMSPMAYVTHPETEVISAAYKIDNHPTEVIFGEATIGATLRTMNLGEFMVVGHNMSGFDAMILAWRFGIRPKMWGCTLAMAKPIHAITVGGSLAKLVQHYGLGTKNQAVLHQTRGRHLKDFTQQELRDMARYNAEDVDQCYGLFQKLKPHYTAKELWHIDATIRMLVEPKFVLDYDKLERSLMGERDNKRKQLIQLARMLGINWLTEDAESKGEAVVEAEVAAVLASAPKFSSLLEAQGVPTPMKASPTNPDKQVPALAKTDEEFLKLQEHPNEIVAAAARARLSVKSTLLETRIEKFIEAADACEGLLPVPLHYCGATTTGRWSGWHMNLQNLPRIPRDKQGQIVPKLTNALRLSMRAPAGHKVVVADLSGIELRVNHFLWQVPSSMELYQSDPEADLYRAFAAARYGIKPEHVTKDQRQLAKLCLAEGTLVLTDRGEVPIEQVTDSDKVWDGVEWVSTLGPICKGEQHAIEYDGLIATPDHEVWVEDGRKLTLEQAAAQSLRLARTGADGVPLGFGGTGHQRVAQTQRVPGGSDSLRLVSAGEVGFLRQPAQGRNSRVPVLPPEVRGSDVASSTAGGGTAEMHEPQRPGLPPLRREGDPVQVCGGVAGSRVGDGEHRTAQGYGAGPGEQQRALRAGQPAVGYAQAERGQSASGQEQEVPPVQDDPPGSSVCGQHAEKPARSGPDLPGDCRPVEPAIRQTKRRVWDLLNAGPRHRFTANGRLVSNCQLGLGFGAGYKTFMKVAKLMGGLDLLESESREIVEAWRSQYRAIVEGWATCHAALTDIYEGRQAAIDPWGLCHTTAEGIRLPSGRLIRYPSLRQQPDPKGERMEWVYGEGRHTARIYSGKIDENMVQALARDVIADNAVDFFKATKLRPSLMVHDELVYIVPEDQAQDALDTLQAIMRTPPKWWPGLVTWSEGDIADSYGDAK